METDSSKCVGNREEKKFAIPLRTIIYSHVIASETRGEPATGHGREKLFQLFKFYFPRRTLARTHSLSSRRLFTITRASCS
jgi:hypothetical protein